MDIKQVMAGTSMGTDQNLIKPDRVDRSSFSTKPRGFYQALLLGGLGVFSAFFVGYAFEGYLSVGLSLWVFFLAALFFFAFSALQVFLATKTSHRLGFLIAEALALFLPFMALRGGYFFAVLGLVFLFLLWGYAESRSELNYGTEIRFFRVTHAVTAKLTTGVLIFAIFFLVIVKGSGGNFFLSQQDFTSFFDSSATIFASFYPGVTVTGSFQDFANSAAQEELANNATFKTLSPQEQTTAEAQGAATLTTNFSRALGVTITPSSTTSGVVYQFIITSLQHWHDRFGKWFLLAWAVVVFLILRSLGVVFIVVAQFFAMIIYEILLSAGIVQVVEHPETKEVVEFS